MPKDNLDVFMLVVLVLTIATAALHGWLVHFIAPIEMGSYGQSTVDNLLYQAEIRFIHSKQI